LVHLPDRHRRGLAQQGYLHRLRLLFLRLPVRRSAVPADLKLRYPRQDGQVHLLRRRPGGHALRSRAQEIRGEPHRRGQAAAVCRSVLHAIAARWRRRHHCSDLQGARRATGLRRRRPGVEHGIRRQAEHVARCRRRNIMSPYRIGGGIAALVLAVLLLIVTVRWVGHTDLVSPTVSVRPEAQSNSTVGQSAGGATSAESPAAALLAERTQLQSDENTKPPSSENEKLV